MGDYLREVPTDITLLYMEIELKPLAGAIVGVLMNSRGPRREVVKLVAHKDGSLHAISKLAHSLCSSK